MRHKILGYLRVSTDEQAAAVDGSLDNQKYRLKAFVDLKNTQEKNWGEIVEWYIDDGYSAKDTRRPAYQRMMMDLKKAKLKVSKLAYKRVSKLGWKKGNWKLRAISSKRGFLLR